MELYRLLVDLDIAPGRSLPGVVCGHTAQLEHAPGIFEAIKLDSAHDRSKELPGIIIGEGKAIAWTGIGVILLNSIGQTAHTTHHRDTAITHSNQLAQAAGFKTRRHEEHVATGIDRLG